MLVHCNDSACIGSNESVQSVVVGRPSSMALDGAGRPAFAFRDGSLLEAHAAMMSIAPAATS